MFFPLSFDNPLYNPNLTPLYIYIYIYQEERRGRMPEESRDDMGFFAADPLCLSVWSTSCRVGVWKV